MIKIKEYQPQFQKGITDLITYIQQIEFRVPVKLEDQPDLLDIANFYQQRNGNFWCAINEKDEVVGTIALIDVGESFGTIRKMFVKAEHRGKDKGIAALLFQNLEKEAIQNQMTALYLGTFHKLKASHRFYEKNGFEPITADFLPKPFPRMQVDDTFYRKALKL
jgi:putative acetyltransferase